MPRVSYKGLFDATELDIQSLTKAALVDGYFDLDLDCPEALLLRQDVRYLESFSEEIFNIPTPLREQYDFKTLGRFRTTG